MAQQDPSSVPVIDFTGLSDPAMRSSICAQIARACETVGFFEVINSAIPLEVLDDAFDVSRGFYDLPMKEKLMLEQQLGDKKPLVPVFQLGYRRHPILRGVENRMEEMVFRHYHMQEEHSLDHSVDSFYPNGSLGDIDPTQNWWPNNPRDYREKVQRLTVELGKAADTLLDVLSESLGLPPTYIREQHHKNTVPRYLNFHYYPKGTKSNENETGLIPHRDSGIFTLLCQGGNTQGLEINPYGQWIPVMPQRGGVIVNVGDILQAWSNGRYKSILHRVVNNKESGRYSFAYFLFPGPGPEADYMVQPISKLVTKKNPPKYVPFSYLDFMKNKMKVDSVTLLKSLEVIRSN